MDWLVPTPISPRKTRLRSVHDWLAWVPIQPRTDQRGRQLSPDHQSLKVLIFKTKLDPQSWYPRDSFLIVERPREIELGVNIDHDAIVQYGHKDDTSLLFIDTNGEHQLNWENNSNNIP